MSLEWILDKLVTSEILPTEDNNAENERLRKLMLLVPYKRILLTAGGTRTREILSYQVPLDGSR